MKYLVMECHPAYAVLMDEESRFVRAANLHYSVGQTVTAPILIQETGAGIRHTAVMRAAAAAACLLLISAAAFGLYLRNRQTMPETHSVVVIAERTRYEIELNKSGEVVSVGIEHPEEGKSVENYDGQHLSSASVIGSLLRESLEKGEIVESDTVQVYVASDDQTLYSAYKTQIEQEAEKLSLNADVQAFPHQAAEPEEPPAPAHADTPQGKEEPPAPPHAHENPPTPPEPADPPAPHAVKPEPHGQEEAPDAPVPPEPADPPAPANEGDLPDIHEEEPPKPEEHPEHPQPPHVQPPQPLPPHAAPAEVQPEPADSLPKPEESAPHPELPATRGNG